MNSKERLKYSMQKYFNGKYIDLIDKRIFVISGDFTLDNFGLTDNEYEEISKHIDCVINCAAFVSHFGDYSSFKQINVSGVISLVDFCKKYSKKLFHISTLSVSGHTLLEKTVENKIFKESDLFIGQNIDNLYVKSKFEAEEIILNAILDGLDAYIFRMGNLTSRYEDGMFQLNPDKNAFANRLKSIIKLECAPDNLLDLSFDFTPIDFAAEAIIKLMAYSNTQNRIFHLFNENQINLSKFIELYNSHYKNIEILPSKEFNKKLNSILNNEENSSILNGLLNDLDENKKLTYKKNDITVNADFSAQYLKELNFEWPKITAEYIKKIFDYLTNVGYI